MMLFLPLQWYFLKETFYLVVIVFPEIIFIAFNLNI